jgi:hypothetical protein
MPRVHFVKKARKKNPVAKKGESYYWWKFQFGGKRYSKTPPKPSQLTQSEFLSSVFALQEEMADAGADTIDDLRSLQDDWCERIQEIGDGCQERFDNMPEGLQQGDTGCLLEERVNAMEMWRDEIESVDIDGEESGSDAELNDYVQEKLSEMTGIDPGI